SRRSGVSRQLINGWARQRVSITLSATIGQLLKPIGFNLSDLLLEEKQILAKLNHEISVAPADVQLLPRLSRSPEVASSRRRLEALNGTFRYRTRLKEAPMFVMEVVFQFDPFSKIPAVKIFEGS